MKRLQRHGFEPMTQDYTAICLNQAVFLDIGDWVAQNASRNDYAIKYITILSYRNSVWSQEDFLYHW